MKFFKKVLLVGAHSKSPFAILFVVSLVTISCQEEHDPFQLIYGTWQTTTWSKVGCDEQDLVGIPCSESGDDVDCVTLIFTKGGKVDTINEDGTVDQAFYSITENGFLISNWDEFNLFSPWNFGQDEMNLQTTDNDGCHITVTFQRQ